MSRTPHDERRTDAIDRRTYLRSAGAAAVLAAVAGCLGDEENGEDDDGGDEPGADAVPDIPMVEDPPDRVYVPTHREQMRMLPPLEAGDLRLAPMLSYPHPFWIVDGADRELVEPEDERGVHMMFTLWDAETGVVLPVDAGAEIVVEKDGERVGSPRIPWPMISQEMGFHFGDNVPLGEDGTYSVEVTLPPVSVETTGDLDGRLTDSETVSFEFEYDDEFRHEVVGGVEYLPEEVWGEPGALEPMDHADHDHDDHDDGHDDHDHDDGHDDHDHDDGHDDHDHDDGHDGHDDDDGHDGHDDDGHDHDHHEPVPYSTLPPAEAYPGVLLDGGEGDELPESGDARFVVTLVEPGSRFVDGEERYLLVSPRTPYNQVPLTDATISVTVERDGSTVAERDLVQTIDGEYGIHYGAAIEDVAEGDSVSVVVETPPQVSRHQGYETAFLDVPPVELTVPSVELTVPPVDGTGGEG